uniref:Reticulon domain-containing protein n=1 Tax=Strongyloides stercoralis TaxID=6248 RepID=A0AAF5D3M6_STRER
MFYQESGFIDQIFTFYVKLFIKSYQFWLKCCEEDNENIFKKVHTAIEKGEKIIDETVTAIEDDIKDVVGSVFEKESRTQIVFQKNFEKNNDNTQYHKSILSETDSIQIHRKNKNDYKNNEDLTTKIKEIVHKLAGTDSATAHITPKLTPEVRKFEPNNSNIDNQRKSLNTSSICSALETSKTEFLEPFAPILPTKNLSNPLKEAIIKKKVSLKNDNKSNKNKLEEIPNSFDEFFNDFDKNVQENEVSKNKENKDLNDLKHQHEMFFNELEKPKFNDAINKQSTNVPESNSSNANKLLMLPTNNNLSNENKKTSFKDEGSNFPTLNILENNNEISKKQELKEGEFLLDKTQPSEDITYIEDVTSSNTDDFPSKSSSLSSTIDFKRGPKNSTFEALIKNVSFN